MGDKVPCCAADAARKVRRITLAGGTQVGIVGLACILEEVRALSIDDEVLLKAELLSRVKARNYVSRSAENDYADALYDEYRRSAVENER